MLGLVSYEGSSDEEDSNDSSPEVAQPVQVIQPPAEPNISDEEDPIEKETDSLENLKVSSESSQFHLPTPTSHNLKPPVKVTNSKIKISIPSLDEFDEEEEEEKPRKAKLMASKKGCGLFSMLPKPRNEFVATPRQLPRSLATSSKATNSETSNQPNKPSTSKPSSLSSKVTTTVTRVSKSLVDEEEEDEGCEEADFFSIPDKTSDDLVPEKSLEEYMKPLVPKKDKEPVVESTGNVQPESSVDEVIVGPRVEEDIELNNDVLRKLGARKRKGEELIVREVDGARLMPDAKEWLTKALSEETAYRPSAKKHEGPTSQQKRKHQITYLAFQAKANELDLKNQWANNRQSKRQTQNKYGF